MRSVGTAIAGIGSQLFVAEVGWCGAARVDH
jgi:hypothetical protein